jgi:hypothetical protein
LGAFHISEVGPNTAKEGNGEPTRALRVELWVPAFGDAAGSMAHSNPLDAHSFAESFDIGGRSHAELGDHRPAVFEVDGSFAIPEAGGPGQLSFSDPHSRGVGL